MPAKPEKLRPYRNRSFISLFLILICLLVCGNTAVAQLTPPPTTTGINGVPVRDTNANKSNTNEWHNETANIHYKYLNSEVSYIPDTSLHTFHRRPFSQPWNRDLGNLGSPSQNLLFTPEPRMGPSLGYHVYDAYRINPDSIKYYNTTRPYSNFTYQLGSKLEQMAYIQHTQNIKPYWNFAAEYRKTTSPGYYKIQRNNNDNASLSTHYTGKKKHYELYGAIVYNKEQHDENGGITDLSLLDSSTLTDRQLLDVNYQNDAYGSQRSSVVNNLRDFTVLLQHSYTLGKADTLYNKDSTQYTYRLIPRFRFTHKFELSTEKHQYKDMYPDSLRYTGFFEQYFSPNGGADSVYSVQKWFWVDNKVLLNGFVGKPEKQLSFYAGIGNRYDRFTTDYLKGKDESNNVSNYVTGELKKEALEAGQWSYGADAQLYVTGAPVGDFSLHAYLGKDLGNKWGSVKAGFMQQLNSAPYNYTEYRNQYKFVNKSFGKESVTQVYATFESPKLKLWAGLRNYLVANYIYLSAPYTPAQYSPAFNITQVWLRKIFTVGSLVLDNELAYQQNAGSAPINVPALMGRHQLSIERFMFKRALKIATGVEVRYQTSYAPAGYDPFLNRFYYQDAYTVTNTPEGSVFFNFRIKQFRAYFMLDQVQQLLTRNTIISSGYAAQNFMIRFGFTWILIN